MAKVVAVATLAIGQVPIFCEYFYGLESARGTKVTIEKQEVPGQHKVTLEADEPWAEILRFSLTEVNGFLCLGGWGDRFVVKEL